MITFPRLEKDDSDGPHKTGKWTKSEEDTIKDNARVCLSSGSFRILSFKLFKPPINLCVVFDYKQLSIVMFSIFIFLHVFQKPLITTMYIVHMYYSC